MSKIYVIVLIAMGIAAIAKALEGPLLPEDKIIGKIDGHDLHRLVDTKNNVACYTISSSHDIHAISCVHLSAIDM